MNKVTTAAMTFFDKYSKEENITGLDFANDYGTFIAQLKMRIRKEENNLYKEFDKIVS